MMSPGRLEKVSFVLVATLCLSLATPVAGAPSETVGLDSLLFGAIRATLLHDYGRADSLLWEARRAAPRHPLPILLMAAREQAEMEDLENYSREERFQVLLSEAEAAARRWLDSTGSADALFCLGTVEAYRAFDDLRRRRYLGAYRHGLRAKSYFEQTLRVDSTYCDARLGIGSFLYWRGRALRFLAWLPLMPDERAEGIDQTTRALECARYAKWTGISNLCWIYLDAGRPEEALRWAQRGLQEFPGSRFFLWPAAEACYRLKRWEECERLFGQILSGLQKERGSSGYNELICYLKIAECREARGDRLGALDAVESALAVEVGDGLEERAEHLFDRARNLREKLLQQNPSSRAR